MDDFFDAVAALADARDAAHAAQQRSHIALWDGFLEAFGGVQERASAVA